MNCEGTFFETKGMKAFFFTKASYMIHKLINVVTAGISSLQYMTKQQRNYDNQLT
jgi:hypothetical protein